MDMKKQFIRIKKAIFTGLSYMIPLVAGSGMLMAAGIVIALITGHNPAGNDFVFQADGTTLDGILNARVDQLLYVIGNYGVKLMPSFLGGYVAYSLAGKPGIAPGFVLGWLANIMNGGFLGGLIGGLIAGYLADFLKKNVKLRGPFQTLLSFMIIPLGTLLIGGLFYRYTIGLGVSALMTGMYNLLTSLQSQPELRILMAVILGGMMASDLGGPISKTAVLFAFGVYSESILPQTYAHIALSVSTTALFCTYLLNKKMFNEAGKNNAITNFTLGIFMITENSIPFAMTQPLIVVPSLIAGGATASGLCALFNIEVIPLLNFYLSIPFVPINNGMVGLLYYVLSFLGGVAVATTCMTIGLRRKAKKVDEALFFSDKDAGFTI